MADYIYLLQTRLTPYQQSALEHVRQVAKARAMTVFLVGGAVRDLTSGSPIRDLDFAVQGNATKLKKELQKAGDDLHRRDFTANAMALSLNEGSFGLLMDPLNGVADIENRELRLVSNYGFIEDPARMIRAARFGARLGWQMEEKTRQRYENAKGDNAIAALSTTLHHYELEEIFHEEDPLRVLKRLEAEGWAKSLFPAWTSGKANEAELDKLRDTIGRLESMGIYPDPSAAYFPLLTAKLAPKDVTELKKKFARPGFAEQIPALETDTKEFATLFTSKAAAAPSDAWKMLFAARPEAVLWLAHTTKSAPLKARFEAFFNDWSQARQKIPYQLMQEMRITPALPGYHELVEKLFFAVMDSKLDTPEAARAFLEPFSPPAPPPPVNMRRRAVKREAKVPKPRGKKAAAAVEDIDLAAEGETPVSTPVEGAKAKAAAKSVAAKAEPVAAKAAPVATKVVAKALAVKKAVAAKVVAKKAPAKAAAKPAAKKVVAKAVSKKLAAKPVVKKAGKLVAKKVVAKKAVKAVAKKVVAKAVSKKLPAKPVAKKAAVPAKKKPVAKAKPVAKKAAKPVAKKVAGKPKPKSRR